MLHIVLFEPEIPQNTGNIMRTCAATGTKLHLIKPLGFLLDEKHLRRAAMDYYEHVQYEVYEDMDDFFEKNQPQTFYLLSRHGRKNHAQLDLTDTEDDIYFMFGKESSGLPKAFIREHLDNCMRIPMNDKVRSLNLANCANIVLFEALRQQNFLDLMQEEPEHFKGREWIELEGE